MFGKGISRAGELVDLGTEYEIINKSGSWYSYKNKKIGQGRENVKKYLLENPEIFEEINKLIREKMSEK